MFDEVSVYARLDSAIFGALIHAMLVTARAVNGNGAAIRLFNGINDPTTALFDGARLALAANVERDLQQWPLAHDSVFEHARRHKMFDSSFRPHQLPEVNGDAIASLCGAVATHVPVRDAYCLTVPLMDNSWCMAVYMRCIDSPPFNEKEVAMLERFKPAISRLVRAGYQRQLHRRGEPGAIARLTPFTST